MTAAEAPRVSRVQPVPRWVLAGALVYPTLMTWLYFVHLADDPPEVQRGAYLLGKLLQAALPAACVWGFAGRPFQLPRPLGTDLLRGLATGLGIAAGIWLLGHFVLLPHGFFDTMIPVLQAKLHGWRLEGPAAFIGLGLFYSLAHSLFEEYYWRWFVDRELGAWLPVPAAVAVSSLGFMAHHLLVLATYFGATSWLTYVCSAGVASGGTIWAMLYRRSGRLHGAWLSHLLVDAALFLLGYELLQSIAR